MEGEALLRRYDGGGTDGADVVCGEGLFWGGKEKEPSWLPVLAGFRGGVLWVRGERRGKASRSAVVLDGMVWVWVGGQEDGWETRNLKRARYAASRERKRMRGFCVRIWSGWRGCVVLSGPELRTLNWYGKRPCTLVSVDWWSSEATVLSRAVSVRSCCSETRNLSRRTG